MATAKMLEFIIGLIIVIIVFVIIGGCVSKFLNPKCDLRAVDAFNAFNTLYTDCMDVNKGNVCSCGEFDIKSLPPDYKILLTPSIKDAKERIRVSLVCNERNAKNYYLENLEGDERIRVYFPDPTKFEKRIEMDQLVRINRDTTDAEKLNKIYTEQGDKIRNNEKPIYISEEVLQEGFEIENTETSHYVKGIGLLLGVNEPLTLVNYNGQVAFLATTRQQEEYLVDYPLPNC